MENRGIQVFPISAVTREGVTDLLRHIAKMLPTLPETVLFDHDAFSRVVLPESNDLFNVQKEGETFLVTGNWIAQLVASTNFTDPDSLGYFQRLIRRKGVIDALEAAGVQEGSLVDLSGFEFEYFR